jgi:hypothetical protein
MTPSWCAALPLVAAALALGGCSDGYPDETDALMLHYEMGQVEALKAMNQIGQDKQHPNPTRFALTEECVLEVHTRRPLAGKESRALVLQGTRALIAKAPDGDSYGVRLERTGTSAAASTVIHGLPWAEATQMKWLLDYVQGRC